MPVPKRYFHCSQELNHDAELWEFTSTFGDRALRTWMQILVHLDRSGNQWRVSGDWVGTLSRMVRQSSANCSRQIRHMVEKGWLQVAETAADGSPLVFRSPNWSKYNRTPEHKGNSTNPEQGSVHDPLLSFPTPTPFLTVPKKKEEAPDARSLSSRAQCASHQPGEQKEKTAAPPQDDEGFYAALKSNSAYAHVDFPSELAKMDAWLLVNPRRKKSRKFVVNWLNRIERPLPKARAPTSSVPNYTKGYRYADEQDIKDRTAIAHAP